MVEEVSDLMVCKVDLVSQDSPQAFKLLPVGLARHHFLDRS